MWSVVGRHGGGSVGRASTHSHTSYGPASSYSARTLSRPGSVASSVIDGGTLRRVAGVNDVDLCVIYPSSQIDATLSTVPNHSINTATMAISNFHIEFNGDGSRFKPGEELSGQVVMDVWATIEIKFVEFVIQGRGTIRVFKDKSTFIERPRHEIYLDKKIILIGPPSGYGSTQLDAGRYVSNFSYVLPGELPPTVNQFDLGDGYVFDITYSAAAHVCDNVRSRYMQHSGQLVRIVKGTKRNFTILPGHDWQSIPGALEPIIHAEQLLLFCSPMTSDPTSIFINMDRGVYPIGDTINLHIEVVRKDLSRVKVIRAELEQQMVFTDNIAHKWKRVLIKAFDDRRQQKMSKKHGGNNILRSSFSMPVPPNLVPSFLPNCHMLNITYCMKVSVGFKKLGGKLVIRLPMVIAPASELERSLENAHMPVFNKPVMQFPYFSKSPHLTSGKETSSLSDSDSLGTSSRSEQRYTRHDKVSAKYNTCLNCSCCLGCMGFGIFDS